MLELIDDELVIIKGLRNGMHVNIHAVEP